MITSQRFNPLPLVLLAILFIPILLHADGTQLGTIIGRVVDQSGAVLPGATVEVTSLDQGTTRTVVADAQGRYKVPLLQPGRYRVSVSLEGFEKFLAQNSVVQVDKTTNIDATLNLTRSSETMTVQGDVPVVDKTNAALKEVLGRPAVREALEKVGAVVHVSTPAEFKKHIGDELAKWESVREKAGIQKQ